MKLVNIPSNVVCGCESGTPEPEAEKLTDIFCSLT